MGNHSMKRAKLQSAGFTLIASLLLLLLLSGMAIGLMMMVNTEGKVGGTDLQNNLAFHAAEGGIEKMYSDLSSTINAVQAPTIAELCAVNNLAPSITGVSFPYYTGAGLGDIRFRIVSHDGELQQHRLGTGKHIANRYLGRLTSGQEAGFYAQIIPISMTVTASMMGGQEVSMMRNAQIALIPVFQFGVFCEGDCAFFSNPTLDFCRTSARQWRSLPGRFERCRPDLSQQARGLRKRDYGQSSEYAARQFQQ